MLLWMAGRWSVYMIQTLRLGIWLRIQKASLLVTQFLPKKKTVFFFILQVPGIIKLNSSLADSQPQYDYLLAIHAKITNNFIDLETQMNTQINQ